MTEENDEPETETENAGEEPAIGNGGEGEGEQQATGDRQQATGNGGEGEGGGDQQATGDRQQATGNGEETGNGQRATGNGQREIADAIAPPRRRAVRVAMLLALLAIVIGAVVVIVPRFRTSVRATAIKDAGRTGPVLPRDRPVLTPVKGTGTEQLAGIVVDGAGSPVAGVAVTAELEPGGLSPSPIPHPPSPIPPSPSPPPSLVVGITGADGRFTLEGMVAGRHHLTLEGNEVFTAEIRFVPVPSDELRLVVARRVAIVGTVTDRGKPQAGATVTIDGDTLSGTRTTTTDDSGHFAFDQLPEGSYRAWAWHGDLVARARRVPRLGRGPFADVELVFEQGAIVVGKVVDRQTNGGVSAAVVLTPLPDAEGEDIDEAPRFARTDADGIFRVEGVPSGRWSADAWAPGWITVGSVDFAAGRGTPTIEMVPGGIVEGRVVGPDDKPMSGVTVSAIEDIKGGGKEISAAAADDRLRRFSGQGPAAALGIAPTDTPMPAQAAARPGDLQFVPRGELGVLLGPIPYPPPAGSARTWQATIVDDSVAPTTLAPPPPGTTIVGDPSALAPLTIDPAYEAKWFTDDEGKFRLTGVPAGDFWIVADSPGYVPARVRVKLSLGQVLTGIELKLQDGRYVAGRVTNQRGEPVAGALLTFTPKDGPERLGLVESVTDSDGHYRAGPLAGNVTVHATAHGHGDHTGEIDLALAPGEDAASDRTYDITLAVADATLEGAVEDPSGLPVVGARVVVDSGPAAGRTATTVDGGRFDLTMLPEGTLSLRVEHADYPPQRFTEKPGDGVRLRLAYGGGIELTLLDHHTGDPILGVTLDASGPGGDERQLDTSAKGRAFAVPIAPGSWTITAAVPGYVHRSITVDVPAGDAPAKITARDVRLELERGAVVAGIVRDGHGDRVIGAKVTIRRDTEEVSTRTDALGEFRLRDVPTGNVELVAEKGGAKGTQTFELRAGDERLSIDIAIQ